MTVREELEESAAAALALAYEVALLRFRVLMGTSSRERERVLE